MNTFSQIVRAIVRRHPDIIPYLADKTLTLAGVKTVYPPGYDLGQIQEAYNTAIYSAMDDYTQSEGNIVKFRNAFRREINDAFNATVLAAWIDGGGDGPIPEALQDYINGEIEREIGYADDVFQQLKELRKTGTPDEIANYIQQRADGYSNALEGYYNYGAMVAQKERPGLWVYGDTVDHCEDKDGATGCATLEGTVHPMSWYIENNFIPRQRGNQSITCGGWNCQCRIVDPKTKETII